MAEEIFYQDPTLDLGYENSDRGWRLVLKDGVVFARHMGWGIKSPTRWEFQRIVQAAFDFGQHEAQRRRPPVVTLKELSDHDLVKIINDLLDEHNHRMLLQYAKEVDELLKGRKHRA